MKKFIFNLCALTLLLSSAVKADEPTMDIIDTAVGAGSFSTLATALTAAGLVDTLKGPGPFTVFAPTDAAFADLPEGTLDSLLADKEALTDILTYHVLNGQVLAADVIAGGNAKVSMLNGKMAQIKVSDAGVMIDDANVIQTDILTTNGVIHVIDKVIIPNTIVDIAMGNPDFSTLVSALAAAGLADTLTGEGPFTVFAPTDAAFAALPEGALDNLLANPAELAKVLTHHVVPGKVMAEDLISSMVGSAKTVNGTMLYYAATSDAVKVSTAMVSSANIEASNGVIHVIDTVLLPPRDCQANYDVNSKVLNVPCLGIAGLAEDMLYQVQLEETQTPLNFSVTAAEAVE